MGSTEIFLLILCGVGGWLLGLGSAPWGRKWRRRFDEEREAHRRTREAHAQELKESRARISELESRPVAPVARPVDPVARRVDPVTREVDPPRRRWFDFGRPSDRPLR